MNFIVKDNNKPKPKIKKGLPPPKGARGLYEENILLKELLHKTTKKIVELIKENKSKDKAIRDLILGDRD